MDSYLGFDIGTTNMKCLVLSEEGTILSVLKEPTPKIKVNNITYFDLEKIESFVDSSLYFLKTKYTIKTVSFSSIGETVVPLKNGKALCNPPLWNEREVTSTEEERKIIRKYSKPEITGSSFKPLFSINKILWMKKNIPLVKDADLFLPLSSYLSFIKTKIASYDYSQASRTGLFDIYKRAWIEELLDIFSISLPSSILPLGSSVGENEKITYGLGGHDHIVGFFAITNVFKEENKSLYYSSMGTSEVLATLIEEEKASLFKARDTAYLSPSFLPSSFIATRSFRNFGSTMERMRERTNLGSDYSLINEKIKALNSTSPSSLISTNGDFLFSGKQEEDLKIIREKEGAKDEEIMESCYLYLGVVTEMMRKNIEKEYKKKKDFIFTIGGGVTKNPLFLSYLSSSLSSPIYMLETEEISALGAALLGMKAKNIKAEKIGTRIIYPDSKYTKLIDETAKRYREFL